MVFLRYSGIALSTIAIVLPTIVIAGCKSGARDQGDSGLVRSASIPLKLYVHFSIGSNGATAPRLYFPLLQIYNGDGQLTYVSHDARANAEVLTKAPGSLSIFHVLPGSFSLTDVIEELPDFRTQKVAFLKGHKVTAVAIDLENCSSCEVQEEALSGNQARMLREGINVLTIKVKR